MRPPAEDPALRGRRDAPDRRPTGPDGRSGCDRPGFPALGLSGPLRRSRHQPVLAGDARAGSPQAHSAARVRGARLWRRRACRRGLHREDGGGNGRGHRRPGADRAVRRAARMLDRDPGGPGIRCHRPCRVRAGEGHPATGRQPARPGARVGGDPERRVLRLDLLRPDRRMRPDPLPCRLWRRHRAAGWRRVRHRPAGPVRPAGGRARAACREDRPAHAADRECPVQRRPCPGPLHRPGPGRVLSLLPPGR